METQCTASREASPTRAPMVEVAQSVHRVGHPYGRFGHPTWEELAAASASGLVEPEEAETDCWWAVG